MDYRFAVKEDTPLILFFIKELAKYEKLENEVTATEELLRERIFDRGRAEVIFALENGKEVGFALFFHNFSTFIGKEGIYLEDLYVLPEYRNRGYGKGLLKVLSEIAVSRDCGRIEWWCLNDNTPSIEFYMSQEALPMNEWTVFRLTEDKFRKINGE